MNIISIAYTIYRVYIIQSQAFGSGHVHDTNSAAAAAPGVAAGNTSMIDQIHFYQVRTSRTAEHKWHNL